MGNAVCYFFCFLVEAIILWQYASHLFVSKHSPKAKLAVLCSLYFMLFAMSWMKSIGLNAALYFLVNFIFFISQCRLKWHTALFHASMLTAIMGACELTVYGLINPHFSEEDRGLSNMIIFAIFNKLIFLTITYTLIHFMKKRKKCSQQQDASIFLLVLIPMTSVFVILTFLNIGEAFTLSPSLNRMITLSAIFLLAINLLVFGINQYNQKKSQEYMEMQLLLQKESNSTEYYKMLLLQNENQSILIHDIKKHLQSIDLLNHQGNQDKISAYIQQLMLSSDLKEVSRLCDHEMLNAILSRYQRQCADKNIAFHADIRSGTVNFITDTDLTSLFCNLLDNAMEAASALPNSFIEISISKREKTPFVVITLINSCRKNPFSKHNGTLATTKADKRKHGFGIKSIHKTVKKYHGDMQMYYNDDTLTFHAIITLKQ